MKSSNNGFKLELNSSQIDKLGNWCICNDQMNELHVPCNEQRKTLQTPEGRPAGHVLPRGKTTGCMSSSLT